jgi:putative ABC transport system substrate-binding protein
MRRREFIGILGGAAAWSVLARAQQPAMPVIGILGPGSADVFAERLPAFRDGLREAGFIEGQNVTFEFRFLHGQGYDRLSALAADLVERRVNVIVAGGAASAAAKRATTSIPIVALSGGDPVKAGLVASLNRPGGNLTAVTLFTFSLGAKRLELLLEAVPKAKLVAVLTNPRNPDPETKSDKQEVEGAAHARAQKILILNASTEGEIDTAFAAMGQHGADSLLVMADPFLNLRREQIVALTTRQSMPAIYEWREHVVAGGLMSYGSSLIDAYRQIGIYTGKILKGAHPSDLPVMQAVKIELVLNMRTAKALGITFPNSLLGRADEVIE